MLWYVSTSLQEYIMKNGENVIRIGLPAIITIPFFFLCFVLYSEFLEILQRNLTISLSISVDCHI